MNVMWESQRRRLGALPFSGALLMPLAIQLCSRTKPMER